MFPDSLRNSAFEVGHVNSQNFDIMASAIVSGASEFIFEDGHFANYPALLPDSVCGRPLPSFVRVSKLPSVAVQENLLDFDGSSVS